MRHGTKLRLTRRGRVLLGVLAALTIAAPVALANTDTAAPASITAAAVPRRTLANCSGTLGDWTVLQHANFGDLTDVDGDPQADVVIVGDSITTRGYDQLGTWLAARGKTLAGSYWSGRPVTPAVDWALSLTTKPETLVMASATNNLFDSTQVVLGQVQRLKAWADAEPKTRLIWVDTYAQRPATDVCDLRNSGWINNQIREGMAGGEVCSWWYGFAQDPNRVNNYLSDGIHPIDGSGGGVGTNYWAAVVGGCIL